MTNIDEHGRPEPPVAGDEAETLVGFLDYQRATFEWKCRGLDQTGLVQRVGVSSMTLAGLMKHLTLVEDYWFGVRLFDEDHGAPWDAVDWDADPDWEWRTATSDQPDDLRRLWNEAVTASRERITAALSTAGLDQVARRPFADGNAPSLRWILCHMIEEYARHNGHADLLREAVDGETGE